MVRAIRGAATAERNGREEILNTTKKLLEKIIKENELKIEDVISIIFTLTPDLTAAFPAAAAREMGITDVALLDMSEPVVDGSLKKCIRILLHTNSEKQNCELRHIYLGGAKALRPDLTEQT